MAALTRTNLIAAIKLEARITTTDLDTIIGSMLDDCVEDMFSKERCYELRVADHALTPTLATATMALPANFHHIDQVKFNRTSTVTTTIRHLFPKNDFVQYKTVGTPQFYEIQGTNLYVFPFSLLTTAHRILITYYKKPTFASGSDTFEVVRLQAALKKECIARIHAYQKQREDANWILENSDRSLGKGMDANPEGRERTSIDTRQPDFRTKPEDSM